MPRTTFPAQHQRCLARVGQYAGCSNFMSKQRGDGLCGSHGRTQDSGLRVNYAKQPTEAQKRWTQSRSKDSQPDPRQVFADSFNATKYTAKYANVVATCRCGNQKLETTFSSENNHITSLKFHCPDCGTRWGGTTA